MNFRLPINAQWSTLNFPRSTLKVPRSGMTMIELVAAMALFVVIFGILLTALNTATNLWKNSRAQRRELLVAQNISDLIADDVSQAVVANTNDYPVFILETPPSDLDSTVVYTVLGLARSASLHTPIPVSETRRSIDAVFYTYYDNALFRHVIPIVTTGFDSTESIGKVMDDHKKNDLTPANHDKIIAYIQGLDTYPTDLAWQWQLLADRMDINLKATIHHSFIRMDDPPRYPNDLPSEPDPDPALRLPPLPVSKLYLDVLPDQMDVFLRLCDKQDWDTYEPIRVPKSTAEYLKRAYLGTLISRRITLPQAGGSRLP